MNINQALAKAIQIFKKAKIPTASLDVEVLLSFVLKKSKEYLFTYLEKKLSDAQQKRFDQLIKRRAKGEPVAYLIKHKEFFGLDFYVDQRVLIPRPETELLVEKTIELLKAKSYQLKAIADIGTGSGCIAVALAKNLPTIKIMASDYSVSALQVAKTNVKKNNVKIKFFKGYLLEPLQKIKIDILVANLPYVSPKWKKSGPAAGLKFEPPKALFTSENGLLLYRQLFKQIIERKQQPKFIICEFDPRQTKGIKILTKKILPKYQAEIKKDLAGLNRLLILKKSCKTVQPN